jgi:hypothetical protein
VGFDGPTGTVVPQLALAVVPVLPVADDVADDPDEEHAAATAATSTAHASQVQVRLPRNVSPLLRPFIGLPSLSVGSGFR